jgi:hypothetical protein
MIKRIAFLSRLPPLEIFLKLFGIDYLTQNEFKVTFLDLSFLIDGQASRNLYKDELKLAGCEIITIRRYRQLDEFVKEYSMNTIFIDMVVGASSYGIKEAAIFRILKKYSAKYYVVCGGLNPTVNSLSKSSGYISKVKRVIKRPSLLLNLILRKAILSLASFNILFPRPHRILGVVGNSQLTQYCKNIRFKKPVTPMNSYNYGDYIEYLAHKDPPIELENICVFLDEDHTNHPDYYLLGIAPLNKNEYILSMNHFFDSVEERTGLSVVIAAHPKSKFGPKEHPYGKRVFIKGKTIDLVAKSKMVIAHSSTSISYPVLFNKPLVLTINNEMKNRIEIIDTVKAFARELFISIIDVDSKSEVGEFRIDLDSKPKYEHYLYSYVLSLEAKEKKPWATVASLCKQDI